MRLATKAGKATAMAVRSHKPPTDTPVVACHQEWSWQVTAQRVAEHRGPERLHWCACGTWAWRRLRTAAWGPFRWGAWSTPVMAERNSSHARTDSQARALICSRAESRAQSGRACVRAEDDDGVVDAGGVPATRVVRSGGHKSRTELLALPSAIRPRVAPQKRPGRSPVREATGRRAWAWQNSAHHQRTICRRLPFWRSGCAKRRGWQATQRCQTCWRGPGRPPPAAPVCHWAPGVRPCLASGTKLRTLAADRRATDACAESWCASAPGRRSRGAWRRLSAGTLPSWWGAVCRFSFVASKAAWPGGGRQSACRDPREQGRQRRVDLVGVDPAPITYNNFFPIPYNNL